MLTSTITLLKLVYLRRRATALVTAIYAELEGSNCGHRLTLELKPRLWRMARKADKLMDEVERLDGSASMMRVTPLLESFSK
ncbi:hypothetical protein R0J87_09430 [Halomonas sp. SIMBA_159]